MEMFRNSHNKGSQPDEGKSSGGGVRPAVGAPSASETPLPVSPKEEWPVSEEVQPALSPEAQKALARKYRTQEEREAPNPALQLPKWKLAPGDVHRMGLEHYDVRILLALFKSLQGYKEFFQWLMGNGYPEIAAFSNAICGDKEAMKFLFRTHHEWLAILSNAIDGEDAARIWIGKACQPVNLMFAMACRQEPLALQWLQQRHLDIFLILAQEIHEILDTQASENNGPYVYHVND